MYYIPYYCSGDVSLNLSGGSGEIQGISGIASSQPGQCWSAQWSFQRVVKQLRLPVNTNPGSFASFPKLRVELAVGAFSCRSSYISMQGSVDTRQIPANQPEKWKICPWTAILLFINSKSFPWPLNTCTNATQHCARNHLCWLKDWWVLLPL